MSRASVAVLFPDGTIKYAIYDGSTDILMPKLFDGIEDAWNSFHDDRGTSYERLARPGDVAPNSGEPVVIYCDYGDGSVWRGTATRDYVTSECNFMEIDDYSDCNFVLPEWVVWR